MDIVLMLCYYFPPLSGGGVQRSTKFAKYLPYFGWQPVVLTCKTNRRNIVEQGIDLALLKEVHASKVIRSTSIEWSTLYYLLYRLRLRKALLEVERVVPLASMNYKIGWYADALIKGKSLLWNMPIRVLYSSSPPYSGHLVARRLKKLFGVPWVADFRDPWEKGGTPYFKSLQNINTKLERLVVNDADSIIANTQLNKSNLLKRYAIDENKIQVIPNGFDSDDFDNFRNKSRRYDRFIISCIGKFHPSSHSESFFAGYKQFAEHHPDTLLRFVGSVARQDRIRARTFLIPATVEFIDRVEHGTAIEMMGESAILLINVADYNCDYWVPGKLYEYLWADRPILFIGPNDGNAAEIIGKTRTGYVVGYDAAAIYRALEECYSLWNDQLGRWAPDREEISQFDRKIQTRQLAEVFSGLSATRTSY